MRKTVFVISILLLIAVTAGVIFWQHNISHPYKVLLHADTLMSIHPDSALQTLKSIRNPQKLHGENQALYALLMTQAQYKNQIPVKNDSLIHIAVGYYANQNDSLRKAWSYLYMAQACRDMKDKKRSLKYYQKASVAAEGCENYKLLDLIYYHWGVLLQNEKPYDEGLDKLMKAKKYAELNKDTLSVIHSLGEIGWVYVWNKEYQLAETHLWKAIDMAKQKHKNFLYWLYQHLSIVYFRNKQPAKALIYIDKAIEGCQENKGNLKVLLATKSTIFTELQQYDSAYYYLDLEDNKDSNNFYSIARYQNHMYKIEKGLGNYKKSLEHYEIYSDYLDSIESNKRDSSLVELQKKYDYSLVQNENIQLRNKSQQQNITILIFIVTFICIVFAFIYAYQKKETVIHNNKLMLEQSLRQLQNKTNELLQDRQTIQEKEMELRDYIRKEQGLKEDIYTKEEKLNSYIQQQKELKEQIFKMNETVQNIEKLNTLTPIQKDKLATELRLSPESFNGLIVAINICYNNFEERLRIDYPSLSNEDVYICCLLKMNIKTQDISYLLGISDEAVRKRKYRIKREKIKIEQKDFTLEDFLIRY